MNFIWSIARYLYDATLGSPSGPSIQGSNDPMTTYIHQNPMSTEEKFKRKMFHNKIKYDPDDVEYLINSTLLTSRMTRSNDNDNDVIHCNISFIPTVENEDEDVFISKRLRRLYDENVRSKNGYINSIIPDNDYAFLYKIILTFGNS